MKAVEGESSLVKATNYRAVVVRSATHKAGGKGRRQKQ